MNISTNCPNCGAPLQGATMCKYCGTVFHIENIKSESPVSFGVSMEEAAEAVRKFSLLASGAISPNEARQGFKGG